MILHLITAIALGTIAAIIYELKYPICIKTTRYDSKPSQDDTDIKKALNVPKTIGLELVDIEQVEPNEFYSITWCGRSGAVVDVEFVEVV